MDLSRCYSVCGLVGSCELTISKMAFGLTVFLSLIWLFCCVVFDGHNKY